jgi:predicted dehydrogenase
VGCGRAARIHLERILTLEGVRIVGCADLQPEAAEALAEVIPTSHAEGRVPVFPHHRELLGQAALDAVAIFTPHRSHYQVAMDALQAGCHVFVEKPLSTNAQEASDIVALARGRNRKVGVGHQYRLCPSLIEARRRILDGVIGPPHLVAATLSAPWLAAHTGAADAWRYEPKLGGGILADIGDHLLDALLWTMRQPAQEVAAFQTRHPSGLDLVTAAALRLGDGTPATLGLSALSPSSQFELVYYGETATLRATDQSLVESRSNGEVYPVTLPPPTETIDGNFLTAVTTDGSLCCPADQALDTVRLIEAITRSASTNQLVRLA